jgi:hypothetical protein
MNDFINSEPYIEKTFNNNCRDCGKEFTINAQCHPKTGAPVTFISKYCKECNIKLRDAFNTTVPINGTINIESAKVPQKNVEGLEESLQTLATSIVNARGEFRAFKKHAEYDIEQNTNNITNTREALHSNINLTFEHGRKIEELNKQNVNRFAEINHIEYVIIPKIRALLIALHIMVLGLFIFDLGVVWYIIKH